ncbi:TIGR03118 family protein [Luteolibacter yonseiensis]|uniref:TIGR03118 family protein n=1 Tax=Luteolibacter yonseiensis TaxID=1144680 RepID=A0A934R5M4_9BACT|nr:TIGR03118 family protein [Luteolibacter yonseiensis]MBK1815895.1 TIGR03118 family protein [Luteolibacter yonseiensis]
MKIQTTRSLAISALLGLSSLPQAAFAETGNRFDQTVLVANRPEFKPTAFVDVRVTNPWGIALRPPGKGGHIWISNARNASTTLYIGDANGQPLHQDGLKAVPIDGPLYSYEDGLCNVTGQVYNAASDIPDQPVEFPVKGPTSDMTSGKPVPLGERSGSAKFVFVTTDGTINAWRSGTAESMDSAVIVKDFSDKGKHHDPANRKFPAFTGVAMTTEAFKKDADGKATADNRLYVTDFQQRQIRTFNNRWEEISDKVVFAKPPGLTEEYSPYNIQCLGDKLCVTYAVLNTEADDPAEDLPGEGFGRIAFFDRDGKLLSTVADAGKLNSPWGVCIAPEGFGNFGGNLLVANFGDGSIAAYHKNGEFHDYLRDRDGKQILIDGIWGIVFGNGVSLGDTLSLYFTAGPNVEQDGIFGRLAVAK